MDGVISGSPNPCVMAAAGPASNATGGGHVTGAAARPVPDASLGALLAQLRSSIEALAQLTGAQVAASGVTLGGGGAPAQSPLQSPLQITLPSTVPPAEPARPTEPAPAPAAPTPPPTASGPAPAPKAHAGAAKRAAKQRQQERKQERSEQHQPGQVGKGRKARHPARVGNARKVKHPVQVGDARKARPGKSGKAPASNGHRTSVLGVDTNAGTMDPAAVKAHGKSFAVRYLSDNGTNPSLTAQEARAWRKAGVPLVSVWQTNGTRADGSVVDNRAHVTGGGSADQAFANGASDARAAAAKMLEVGGAGDRPIYFSADFRVKQGDERQLRLVQAYFDGIASVLPKGRIGAYGSYATIKQLFDTGTINYGWQQTFRTDEPVDPRAQLRQYDVLPSQDGWGVSGAGALDMDRAVRNDYGQWTSRSRA